MASTKTILIVSLVILIILIILIGISIGVYYYYKGKKRSKSPDHSILYGEPIYPDPDELLFRYHKEETKTTQKKH
jgi:hypothetical protein